MDSTPSEATVALGTTEPGLDVHTQLRRSVPWGASLLLAIGAALLITVSLGSMASELGNLQIAVWGGAALLGLAQCFLIAELATHSGSRAGGTATYAHEAVGARAPWLAALSGWGYWFAWTPGIAVNLILASEYLRATVAPGINPVAMALATGAVLYGVNILGLRFTMRVSAALAVLAGIPLLAIMLSPLFQPSLFDWAHVWPLRLPEGQSTDTSTGALVIKWLFVATWSAYGAELASTIVAEIRDSGRTVVRAMSAAGVTCLIGFTMIPLVMTGLVGSAGLDENPTTVFLPAAEAVFGDVGKVVVGLMLAAALTLSAVAFIIASSRTLYQMSHDRYLPRFLGRVNRFGMPVGSMIFDFIIIAVLLFLFGTNVVDVVAAANVGYLVVFVVMPISFVIVRIRRNRQGESLLLPRWWTAVGVIFALANAILLIAGALVWGLKIALTGAIVTALILPIMWWRRRQDRRSFAAALGPDVAEGEVAQ